MAKTKQIQTGYLIQKYRDKYLEIKPVTSPALKQEVYFNMAGFKHLVFKGPRRRPTKHIINRLALIPLIVPVIKNSHHILETGVRKEKIKNKYTDVTYCAVIAKVGRNKVRVKVVVRKIGLKGRFFFYSVMKY